MLDYTRGSKGNYRALGVEHQIILPSNAPWKDFTISELVCFQLVLETMVVIEPVHLDRKLIYLLFGCYLDSKLSWNLFVSSV